MIGADIYFPDVEPFASNDANKRFVAKTQQVFNYVPDKYMALGAASLQIWAAAANEEKSLDRETLAKRIRGGDFKGTIFGDAKFEPNGQLQSKHYLFTVENQKITVQLDGK